MRCILLLRHGRIALGHVVWWLSIAGRVASIAIWILRPFHVIDFLDRGPKALLLSQLGSWPDVLEVVGLRRRSQLARQDIVDVVVAD